MSRAVQKSYFPIRSTNSSSSSKSYHVGRKIVTYNLISKSIGRKSKRKFYVWPSIPIPVWLFIVLYAQAGGLTHWLVMPLTLWSGAKIDFIWLMDKHKIKIVCLMFPFFSKFSWSFRYYVIMVWNRRAIFIFVNSKAMLTLLASTRPKLPRRCAQYCS